MGMETTCSECNGNGGGLVRGYYKIIKVVCEACDGTGVAQECSNCFGEGKINASTTTLREIDCDDCEGTGIQL